MPGHSQNSRGLSPRVRGNRRAWASVHHFHGSIPACAGEPEPRHQLREPFAVYPRVCGGTPGIAWPTAELEGLSPRVRGNPRLLGSQGSVEGSIPACAGEPPILPRSSGQPGVYPRVCGGTLLEPSRFTRREGLSPRVRGNHVGSGQTAEGKRSIPACAGEPMWGLRKRRRQQVYPRVCGGTRWRGAFPHRREGLSPRVRGNPRWNGGGASLVRSIPACAGEPFSLVSSCASPRVYPRVCGGTPGGPGRAPPAWGLSPRVRGNRVPKPREGDITGSIPACAGEPGSRSSPPAA